MKRKLLLVVCTIFFVSTASSAVVVNSNDWHDNALAVSYSHFRGGDVRMVTNLGEGKLIADMLDENKTHTVLESSQAAWPNYNNYLDNQNIDADTRSINWSESQYRLYSEVKENVSGFIVVKPGYGIDTISVFSKVIRSDYWLLYYEEGETLSFLEGKEKPKVFYGRYLNQPWKKLDGDQKVINKRTKNANNLEMVERLLESTEGSSVTATGDSYIEKGFLKKGSPIVVNQGIGQTVEVLRDHNVSVIQVIGAENVNFGNSIKDRLGDSVTVIAKFGRRFTGVQGLKGTYPLKKLPVNPVKRNIDLERVAVDEESSGRDLVRLEFSNQGNIPTTVNFSAVQIGQGEDSVLLSEFRRKKIRDGDTVAMNMEANLSSNFSTASVSYDYPGKTGLTTQEYEINRTELQEISSVKLKDMYYSESGEKLVVKVDNQGDQTLWVSAEIDNLKIFNRTETVLSEKKVRVGPGSVGKVTFDVYLSDQGIESNGNLTVTLATGKSMNFSSNLRTINDVSFDVREGLTGAFWKSTAPMIAVALILVILIAYRYGRLEPLVSRFEELR